ncbi:MAG: methylamine utilization protein MauG, partial [Afipia sp.]|nr:methylamine utilization protein MauG [Afipia sp.]
MALFEPGKTLFKSRSLSLNGNISCQQCHLDQFGSADGIPNAVAVGGDGKGAARVMGAGGILPRNTLPFWGRGGKGFDTFFWDGKVDFLAG